MDTLYFVLPCFNEQEVLAETVKRLVLKLGGLIADGQVSNLSRILFVDDGSNDATWGLIERFHKEQPLVTGLKLSHNRGHQNALLAGLMIAKDCANIVISMDADLQDDIAAVDEFIKKYHEGCDIVYGVRSTRKNDTFFKRFSAQGFYKLMNFLGAKVIYNHADYRLMSKRALKALESFKETNLFLRGIIPLIGFKSSTVLYERHERFAGQSKYPLTKMLGFALEGILSFSIKPIKIITTLGFVIFSISILLLIYFLFAYFTGRTVQGWTTIAVSVWAIGGLQLLAIGVIGEYIGKIYLETKSRPRYIIEKFLNDFKD